MNLYLRAGGLDGLRNGWTLHRIANILGFTRLLGDRRNGEGPGRRGRSTASSVDENGIEEGPGTRVACRLTNSSADANGE